MVIDIMMTIILILLMSYSIVGARFHEYLGIVIACLYVIHHVLNRKWLTHLFSGKYSKYRVFQTLLIFCISVTMIGSLISGIMLSRYIFHITFLKKGFTIARNIHILSAYWGFIFMSLHLGIHWNMVVSMAGRIFVKAFNSPVCKWILRVLVYGLVIFGVWSFVELDFGSYLLLKNLFVFIDDSQNKLLVIFQYISVMSTFIFAVYYVTKRTLKK